MCMNFFAKSEKAKPFSPCHVFLNATHISKVTRLLLYTIVCK